MPALDIDPEILRVTAAASAHAYAQSIWHIEEEIRSANGIFEPLYETLTDEGPYAYMVWPDLQPDGSIKLPRLTTFEEIVECYGIVRGQSDLLEVLGLTEIRGTWFTFQDNVTRACMRSNRDTVHSIQTLGLFPSGSGPGITGELVWIRVPVEALGSSEEPNTIPSDPLAARERIYRQFEAFLDAARANDVDAVMATLHDKVASTVRDYVEDTGTITAHEGAEVTRSHYEALFARYEVRSLEKLSQVTEDWYVFAELRWEVTERDTGGRFAFHTAEMWMPARTGTFIARVGHGTEPAPIPS